METNLSTGIDLLAESPQSVPENDGHFDDAFIEDSDQSSTILDHSSEAITDKSLRRLNNSSIAAKEEIAADRPAILHWPRMDPSSVNRSELSSEDFCTWEIGGTTPKSTERNCVWEMAGITPKSTEKAVCDSAMHAVPMDYCTTAMSPSSLKGSPSTVSMVTKNCSVKVRDILLAYDSPTKKTDGFSTSPRSVAFGEILSSNMPQSQPLGAQNDTVSIDDCCRGKRRVNSFCGKKLLKARAGSVKKRPWKEKDVSRKRKCLDPSITIVPPVSSKDSPSKNIFYSKEDLIVDQSFLLTSMTLPNSSPAQSLSLNSPLKTNHDIDSTGYWVKNKRILGQVFEKKLLEESVKTVKRWTRNVASRKRKHMGRLADETFALSQPTSDIETSVVKLPLHSDETVCPSPAKNELICSKMIQTIDVCDDVSCWAAPSSSDENLRLIPGDLASSNSEADEQNCVWEMYSGEKFLSLQNSGRPLANAATEPSGDENAVLANELKNWEPFSTDVLNKTVGGIVEDTEMAQQDIVTSDADLARTTQNTSSDQLTTTQAKKKRGRRSMSADREIVSQMMEMICSESSASDASTAFPYKRYPQRLRRRSTELLQFTQIEAFHDVAEEPETVTKEEGSPLEPEMNLLSESLANIDDMKLSFESTARSEDEPTLDFDAPDSDFNLYPVPAKPSRRLRRKSTDLFRLTQKNQNQLSATFEEMPEEQDASPSQKAQNDTVNAESRGKQTGTNKPSRRPRQKKGKAEDGPPLEDIYLNRLWRSQMPKDTSWETIPEDPKYSKETGSLRVFSARKAKRFLDFDEGPSPSHLKKRKLKARKNGWKPLTKRRDTALSKLLTQKLLQLDGEIGAGE